MPKPKIVSRDEWTTARKRLLAKEKELTRQRDALSAERRSLPMVALEKEYVFEGPEAGAPYAARSVRQAAPAHRLPLHVRSPSRLGGRGVPGLLVCGRQLRRQPGAPRGARDRVRGDLARPVRQDRAVQTAHGLDVPVAVVARDRLQRRLWRDARLHAHELQLCTRHRAARGPAAC